MDEARRKERAEIRGNATFPEEEVTFKLGLGGQRIKIQFSNLLALKRQRTNNKGEDRQI